MCRVIRPLHALIVIGVLAGCVPSAGSAPEIEEGEPAPLPDASPAGPRTGAPSEEPSSVPSTPADCTYYVAPDGDDTGPGSAGQPWQTLEYAAEMARPGDVVCFREGIYPTDEIHLTTSGSGEAWITFTGLDGGQPVLDGRGSAGGILILEQGTSYIRFSGFTLTGFTIWGITLAGDNHHVQLDHLDVGGGEAGVHFTVGDSGSDPEYGPVSDVVLAESVIHDSLYTAVDCTPGPCDRMTFRRLEISGAGLSTGESSFGADGLAVERGEDILVEDCTVHDNGGDGIDLNSRDTAGYVSGIVVQRNQVYRNRLQAIKLWAGGRMQNNAIWGQGINPVMLGVFPGDFVVVNNTIAYNMWDPAYSARDYAFIAAYPETGSSAAITLTLLNNIFAYNTGPQVGPQTSLYLGEGVTLVEAGGNLFYSDGEGEIEAEFWTGDPWFPESAILDGQWAEATGSRGDIVAGPLFVGGWPDVNLRLQAGSPAINAGLTSEAVPPDDLTGRPRDAQPDIGAYEAGG